MQKKFIINFSTILAILLFSLGSVSSALGAEGLPNYQLQFLGPGSPSAINNYGVVVGAKLNGNNYEPLVSVGGAPLAGTARSGRRDECLPNGCQR